MVCSATFILNLRENMKLKKILAWDLVYKAMYSLFRAIN